MAQNQKSFSVIVVIVSLVIILKTEVLRPKQVGFPILVMVEVPRLSSSLFGH